MIKLSALDKAAEIAIVKCMGTKPKESILVISDETKREIGLILFDNAIRLGYKTLYVEMKPGKTNGEEPPAVIADLMKKYDVVFCPTAASLTHTAARREASALGARVATFPGITAEVMIRGLNADYVKIADRCLKVKKVLEKGKMIRVTTALGTDISFSIQGRTVHASKGLFHKKGESGNLPTGETYLAPVEGTANGVFYVDGSMAGLGLIENVNLKIEVKDGFATKITGGNNAKKLTKMLSAAGPNAFNIAEFGVGTNDKAKLSGVLLEDEKVMGTIHIALGNNKSMGGNVDVPIHLDGVVKSPTVYMDDKIIMKNGKLLII
ncbi:MAG: aminopeptidase [Ignavibacteriales bacterium]|nr:aminopeptidase [Ignavibacteriales bacterium]